MTDIKTGDRLLNNDPRIPVGDDRKIVTVTEVLPNGDVKYYARTRRAFIGRHRIFTDGKTRAAGYNLLPRGEHTQSDMSDMA